MEEFDVDFQLDRELIEADLIGQSPSAMAMKVLGLLYNAAPRYTKLEIQKLFRPG